VRFSETGLEGVLLIEPSVHRDGRGSFCETFRNDTFMHFPMFVQENQSVSHKGVIRGIHYQEEPYSQGKLVRVPHGRVYDVAVDLKTGEHVGFELSGENNLMLYIPSGYGHAFQALEDNTVFSYKCTNFYNKESERGVRFDDSDINIAWPIKGYEVNGKDNSLPLLRDIK